MKRERERKKNLGNTNIFISLIFMNKSPHQTVVVTAVTCNTNIRRLWEEKMTNF